MSNKEMKDGLQEDTSGVSDENTGIEEEINATMDKIIAPPETDEDEMDDLGDYDDSAEEEPDPQPVRHHRKSARPGPVVYVPVDDMEMPDQTTSRKKKSKKTNTQKNRSAKPEYQNPKPVKKHKGARVNSNTRRVLSSWCPRRMPEIQRSLGTRGSWMPQLP